MAEPRLRSDERGAIMLLGLFFVIFAVAMLYSIVGVGQAVLFRQGMQNSADASALSGAVMDARLLNLIVLINIIMSALLAILVALKLVELLTIIGIGIATALAFPTFGASLAAIPILTPIQQNVHTIHDELEPPIHQGLEALHLLAVQIRDYGPGAAQKSVSNGFSQPHSLPATEGFIVGGEEFPVEDGEFKVLCGKAGEFPFNIAEEALVMVPDVVFDLLAAAMGGLATQFSTWFCGDGEGGPPSYGRDEDVWYPKSPTLSECQSKIEDSFNESWTSGASAATNSLDCGEQVKDDYLAQPNSTGGCMTELPGNVPDEFQHFASELSFSSICEIGGPYDERIKLARKICAPTTRPRWEQYSYQLVEGEVDYKWTGSEWDRQEQRDGPPKKIPEGKNSTASAPCGRGGSVDSGYNPTVRTTSDVNDVEPVCIWEEPGVLDNGRGNMPSEGDVRTLKFKEVRHILGCARKEEVKANVEANSAEQGGSSDAGNESSGAGESSEQGEGSEEGSGDKTPQAMKEKTIMGGEEFQIRALVKGDSPSAGAERIVRLSLWGKDAAASPVEELRVHGQYAVAQAEYYYDGTEKSDEWMWNMKWRGRLVRVRPTEATIYEFNQACGDFFSDFTGGLAGDNPCAGFIDTLAGLDQLIIH